VGIEVSIRRGVADGVRHWKNSRSSLLRKNYVTEHRPPKHPESRHLRALLADVLGLGEARARR